uniref:Transmembrane protein 238 n=1 Tax=Lepisosteus oculatus TaxID=7918 RepID=W5NMJ6_LEPOC
MAPRCIGKCIPLFILGIVFDVIGITLLLIGIFANVQLRGMFFGDFLIYTGAIVIFLSLIWWILWYTGNIEVSMEELEKSIPSKKNSFAQWARKFSERLSQGGLKTLEAGEKKCIGVKDVGNGSLHAHSTSKITWENSDGSGYDNRGLDKTSDVILSEEKTLELDILKKSEALLQNIAEGKVEMLL